MIVIVMKAFYTYEYVRKNIILKSKNINRKSVYSKSIII